MSRIRNIAVVILSVVVVYLAFISGKNSAVNKSEDNGSFIAAPHLYHNVHELYADHKAKQLQARFERLNKKGVFNGTVLYAEYGKEVFRERFRIMRIG